MNWSIVAALAGALAALAAIIGAGAIVWQTYRTTRVEVVLRLLSEWQSRGMGQTRAYAAGRILADDLSSPYIDDVLDFFETVAMFWKQKVLNEEITWHAFYWPMACYWRKIEAYIHDAQDEEGSETWKDYCDLMQVLIRREGSLPSADAVERFFSDEASRGGT